MKYNVVPFSSRFIVLMLQKHTEFLNNFGKKSLKFAEMHWCQEIYTIII